MKKRFLPLLLIANLSFAQVDLNLGLKAYYPFSGNANDISGNNNNPVFNNATLTADRFGNPNSAYHFDGATTYMQVPNSASLNTTNKLSLSAWVKPMGFYSGPCHGNSVITKGTSGNTPGLYMIWYDDNAGTNGANCSGPLNPVVQNFYGANSMAPAPGYTPYIQTNQWYHVIVIYDGTTVKLYVNCELKYSGPQGGINFTNTDDLFIGKVNNAAFPYWLNGDLDEIRIYDRALTVDEVNVLGGCTIPLTCNNWLSTPNQGSYVTTGDLDITGNQLTVEAVFNRTAPLNSGLYYGHLVSKHSNSSNVNYALLPNGCEITTSTGYKSTFQSCPPDLGKTYHVAMVYDGTNLKYYRNGFLLSQVACTGNMITNNFETTIAQVAGAGYPPDNQFLGYANEVRIWNVARTQSQLQTYMDASLPNPTTQTGLQGYYTFDNLLNKQGNAVFNATLNGASAINATNTNCTFVPDSCAVSCNNWLSTPSDPSYATAGDIDVTGNQLTVEAVFNRTAPPPVPGSYGFLVSKHLNEFDNNYALWPNGCALTTSTNPQAVLAANCDIELNKTYHVAMVYDGTSLKFYRNGFLHSQTPMSGNLINNNLLTQFARNPTGGGPLYQFLGNMNEVRIWNVARTQVQIQTFMNSSLPNPTTTTGLLAYYTFDNLLNKQGNTAFNASLNGAATINATNPNCTFIADSCAITTPPPEISNIINDYTPVLAFNPCDNKLTVEDGTRYNDGDTVLLIQMKGAVIDSTNTAGFGTITDYKNAGNYEFNYVKSKSGNIIELKNKLTRQYDIPVGKVQLIRVPYYNSANVSATLTCLPWDGNKGGVLVVNVRDTLTLNADVNTTGRGFLKGVMINSNNNTFICGVTDFYYPDNAINAAGKGEGITFLSTNRNSGKGPAANGGGGGMNSNSGGAGGSNGSIGGRGGYEWNNCPNYLTSQNWGFPGKSLTYNTTNNKVFMGGGGGAGHCNNQFDDPAFNANYNGGNGGGMIIINSAYINNNGKKIISKGDSAYQPVFSPTYVTHDGMGGGGAGGSVLLNCDNYINNLFVDVSGGKGANMVGNVAVPGFVGPGGGGGGGVVWVKQNTLPAPVNITNAGGLNGVVVLGGNNPHGAAPGLSGINVFSLTIPIDTVLFKKNIDSVRIKDSIIACLNVDFKGLAYTNTNPISTWQWYFGDAGTANTQNTTHTYAASGTYMVKLVVTDINGCKDSVLKPITVAICTNVIINDYTPVLSLNPCTNTLNVEDGTAYNVGDTVLLIQMKGAIIDSTNTAAFGSVTDYKNSGNYEFNYVKSRAGNNIELLNKLTRQYDIPVGKVQLIRVPYYSSLSTSDILTCLPWDGTKGGVLVFNVLNNLTLNNNIDVTGMGFNGGIDPFSAPGSFNCNENQYYYPPNPDLASGKGEGIAEVSAARSFGKGALANGGGGGNSHNSGGAGGGNIGSGGSGGYQFESSPCNGTVPFDNGGISGRSLTYTNTLNKIFLGGGGGAGHSNNPEAFEAKGGNGGGIIIFSAGSLTSNSKKIIANGNDAVGCGQTTSGCHEGMGGGGAAGAILLKVTNYLDNATIETRGGKGGDMTASGFSKVGPGGGGSGGPVWLTNSTLPANVTVTNNGGLNGVCIAYANNPWGATAGSAGQNLFDLVLPIDQVPFTPNIDSVRIKDSVLNCNGFDFKGLAYTNTNPIATWQWYFGDGNTANTQNTTHAYGAAGTYTVKLVVTDINGCMDSISKDVVALPGIVANAGIDTSFCSNGTITHVLQGSGNGTYSWSPAIYLNDPTLQNPTATISSTTTFYLTVTGGSACASVDSVTIFVNPLPAVQTLPDTSICKLSPLVLTTTSGAGTYHWSPGIYVSDSTIASPVFIDTLPRTLVVTRTNAAGCFAKDTININIKPLPAVKTIEDTLICSINPLTLFTNGAQTYSWTPAIFLSDPNIANPVYSGDQTQTYVVTGTGINGCIARDTVTVNVNMPMVLRAPPDKTMCNQSSVQLDGFNGSSVDYLWSPATYLSSTTIINPVTTTPVSTVYSVVITDRACNYDSSFNVNVIVLSAPVINAGKSNDIDCAFRSATLSASGGDQYTWSPATGLNNANIPNPVATPAGTQQYIVRVINAGGCANTDTVTVFVNYTASLARYMPNAFTPDGNGRNDCYGLKNWMYIKQLQFYIFNRYGEQVFATNNPNTCWDGTYKGKPALAGAYVYVIKAQTDCGLEEQKGNFLLIR